ncbi:SDR family NAD(P)-dependent oxidoreductase [Xenorhabdus sp. PB30.3]|uniref:SDR family NAD(P)-dependent oxidoreductase n=1 Tax=Xenorhabdus sp. PB30.3 TaxID=2788941 RepID=UPI001E657FEE|nr:SDR family NAD(P)-dependent oxidoreductase [Xenorhabdus sp. PB30.3]MCC8379605.1 SDR family oxidoreductase [Xenorhabdus sp. PB30.3]
MSFNSRVAIITGSTDGIGEKVADVLYAKGASVVIASRSKLSVENKAKSLSPDGKRALGIQCDVSDPAQVRRLIDNTVSYFGRLDFAVNSAGITGEHNKTIPEQTLENWDRVISTTLSSVFYCMKYEIPAMQKSGGGAIVNLSAVNGLAGIAGLSPYTVAKHGVIGLTKTAALEFACKNIRVNAVAPGYVSTPKINELPEEVLHRFSDCHPMKRMAKMEEVAEFISFLLSEKSSFCTGGIYPVDGGYLSQ